PSEEGEARPPTGDAPAMPATQRRSLGRAAAVLTGLALLVSVIVLAVSNRQLRQEMARADAARSPAAYGSVWTAFLADKNPPLVILSNPPILRFINASDPEPLVRASIPLKDETVEALRDKFVTNPEVSIKESGGP